MTRWLGLPVAASAHVGELDFTMGLVHWLMLALFAGWGAFFVYTLVRFRRKRNPTADYTGVKRHYSTWVEIGVGVFEAVLLFAFSIPFWATRVAATPPPEAPSAPRNSYGESNTCGAGRAAALSMRPRSHSANSRAPFWPSQSSAGLSEDS